MVSFGALNETQMHQYLYNLFHTSECSKPRSKVHAPALSQDTAEAEGDDSRHVDKVTETLCAILPSQSHMQADYQI